MVNGHSGGFTRKILLQESGNNNTETVRRRWRGEEKSNTIGWKMPSVCYKVKSRIAMCVVSTIRCVQA
jgi:hypothetical protein